MKPVPKMQKLRRNLCNELYGPRDIKRMKEAVGRTSTRDEELTFYCLARDVAHSIDDYIRGIHGSIKRPKIVTMALEPRVGVRMVSVWD